MQELLWFPLVLLAAVIPRTFGNNVSGITCNVTFSFLSWNVNGVKKFHYLPSEIRFIRSHDIAFLQETFSRDPLDLLELRDFYSHHVEAKPSVRGRNHWGLSSFFRRDSFKNGTLES